MLNVTPRRRAWLNRRSLVNREECSERIHLADEYSRLVTDFNTLLDALRAPPGERNNDTWKAAEAARNLSEKAWEALEKHIAVHRCMDLQWAVPNTAPVRGSGDVLAMAALAALDVILVVNDDRRYVDVNDAASALIGLPRSELIGRRLDEFFREPSGITVPTLWEGFIADGVQVGLCELIAPGPPRRFEYRAKANFAPGLHLSVLRELKEE
jgi:PAS domain-containing protein